MPSLIVDRELAELDQEIVLPAGYETAYVVVRFQHRPIGRIWIEGENGRISVSRLQRAAARQLGQPLWDACLDQYLSSSPSLAYPLPPAPLATVAICTRNRTDDLSRTLAGLLQLPQDGQEMLVIDNCPSDESTRHLVNQYPQVRYIHEKRPGLNIARNRALREARYDLVAFTDDDAVPEPEWLRALLRNFNDDCVACTTGLTLPLELETSAQECFERYSPFQRGFQRRLFDLSQMHPLLAGRAGAGANMALRRSALADLGLFDEALDAGTPTQSGGDTDMFARILTAGYQIIYEPGAVSWHRHRRTWEELRQVLYGYGVGVYATWTRNLFLDRELFVIILALNWFRQDQLPGLVRSLRHKPQSLPLDLRLAELRGCLAGPWAYIRARWEARVSSGPQAKKLNQAIDLDDTLVHTALPDLAAKQKTLLKE